MDEAALARARDLAYWRGPVAPEPLAGGLSNRNFTVLDGTRRHVVRIGGDVPAHAVWRFNEVTVSRAAHAAAIVECGWCDRWIARSMGCSMRRHRDTARNVRRGRTRALLAMQSFGAIAAFWRASLRTLVMGDSRCC